MVSNKHALHLEYLREGVEVRKSEFDALMSIIIKHGNQKRELRRLNNVIKQMRHDLDRAHEQVTKLANQLISTTAKEAA